MNKNYIAFYGLRPGDEIVVPKSGLNIIQHHGLYLGYDQNRTDWIIHNNAGEGVRLISAKDFFNQCGQVNQIIRFNGTNHERKQLVKKALMSIGKPYNLIFFNCEHFTSDLRNGKPHSKQIELLGFGLLAAFIIGGLLNTKRN